ncbi:MAG TPA: homocysteine S-methyltransferase [Nocardioidaceae bacterium]|nr:homocysteine S-methyltransferase [Nocardioidaceae bacterium]
MLSTVSDLTGQGAAPPLVTAMAARAVVLDGGLATYLESTGHDLSGGLWSARLLLERPAAIVDAHTAFFAAGAQVATTASYQVSYEGLAGAGLGPAETDRLLRQSVSLARAAAAAPGQGARWVAASIGPYGAALADGSEYRGDYGLDVAELRRWHRRRFDVLAESDADVLALETIPCLAEVEALLGLVSGSGRPCWLSLTCANGRTRAGEDLDQALAMARDIGEVVAVGVNCTDPSEVSGLVRRAHAGTGKPAVAYPNSGETWDASHRRWTGRASLTPRLASEWAGAGARLVGGCCRVGPAEVRAMAAALAAPTSS